jgi:DNA-binding transcriptional LysR family regulator
VSLRAVNLNLIPVLRALLRTRSVSGAAAELQLTQPTVSVALAHLRRLLGDPLLVRVGRRSALTPRALELTASVEAICAGLEGVLQPASFDPARARRTITIGTADHIVSLIGGPLADALQTAAPGMVPHFMEYSAEIGERHRLGEIDLLIMPRSMIDLFGHAELRIRHLFDERFVHVVAATHPLAALAECGEAEIARAPAAIFSPAAALPPGAGRNYGFDDWTDTGGRVAVRTAQIGALPLMAAFGGLVAVAPLGLVTQLQEALNLRIVGTPLPPIEICLAWSPLRESDPAHRFFRALLTRVVARLPA